MATFNPYYIELTFPCPSCGSQLTIREYSATGPCPSCLVPIEMCLHTRIVPPAPAPQPPQVHDSTESLPYDKRRFRPSSPTHHESVAPA